MTNQDHQAIFITGASAGLGRATAKLFRRTSKNFNPDLELLLSWLKAGRISVPIKATFTLEEIQKAHREYASSARMGSIVVEISQ